MRGHDLLIAYRRRGKRPPDAWIFDGQPRRSTAIERMFPAVGEIHVEADESPARLDLRCVVGMTVHVMSESVERMRDLCAACIDAGAARVLGSAHDPRTSKVVSLFDTVGDFVEG